MTLRSTSGLRFVLRRITGLALVALLGACGSLAPAGPVAGGSDAQSTTSIDDAVDHEDDFEVSDVEPGWTPPPPLAPPSTVAPPPGN